MTAAFSLHNPRSFQSLDNKDIETAKKPCISGFFAVDFYGKVMVTLYHPAASAATIKNLL